jgi:PAS domain S-box-containing protein
MGWVLRYGLAVVVVAAAMGLRLAFQAWVGPGLPVFVTFYPAIMVAAMLAGFGPGLTATALAALIAGYWVLPPVGQLAIESPVDRLGLVIFIGMGIFISVVAKLYRSNRIKAAVYDSERALRESQARLRRFYESELLGIIYWNMNGAITDANDYFLKMAGYTRQELTAGSIDWIRMTPPEYRYLDEQSAADLKATGVNSTPFEKEYIRKDGTRVPVLVAAAMLDDARFNGVAFVLDISERKTAEHALHRSEERYRMLFNAQIDGFCIIKVIFDSGKVPIDYRFLECNPAFEEQTGLQKAEGKLMRELVPDHEEHWFELYGKVALTGEPASFENEAKALKRWFEGYAYRVDMPEDRHVAIIFNDITIRKQAEEKIQRHVEDLQAKNAELERANRVMIGRELRMIELKKEVNELCKRAGEPPRYKED